MNEWISKYPHKVLAVGDDYPSYFELLMAKETETEKNLPEGYRWDDKGFSNIGIRELCRSVNEKESAFYNHYKSKDELFGQILTYFKETSSLAVFSEEEIQAIVNTGDIQMFFEQNMQKFSSVAGDLLYHTILSPGTGRAP